MRPTRRTTTAVLSAAAVATLAGCAGGAAAQDDVASTADAGTSASSSAGSGDSAASSGRYSDGTYTATGSYVSPGGEEDVEVTLTLADGVVTAATVTPRAENRTAQQYQAKFASGIADEVVGVPLDELDVGAVSGSSLTGEGFMAAVEQIAADAAA